METIPPKHHFHAIHVPTWHEDVTWMKKLVRNPAFWVILGFAAFTALLITLAALFGEAGGDMPQPRYFYPFMP